jgi:hypothetical protein
VHRRLQLGMPVVPPMISRIMNEPFSLCKDDLAFQFFSARDTRFEPLAAMKYNRFAVAR